MDNLNNAFNTRIGEAEAAAQTANCCNLFSWFFAWWVIFSPLTIWYKAWINGVFVRLGTGPWVVSANTQSFSCGIYCTGIIQNSWIYWSDLNGDNACVRNTSIYENWAKPYGFCDKAGGTFDRGSDIKTIEAFVVLTLIFATFAACAGCSVRASGSKGLHSAACCSFLTWLSAVVAFSMMVSSNNEWYKDLRSSEGSTIPLVTTNGLLVAYPVKNFWFGPTFGMLITIFVVSLFAHLTLQGAAIKIDAELSQKDEPAEDYTGSEFDYAEPGKPVTMAQA